MEWASEGYVLSVRKHGETSAIIDVFTRDKGRHMGLVRGGVSRKMRPVLQVGNKIKIEWRARLAEHLGYYTAELLEPYAASLMDDRLSLAGLNSACALARDALPERAPYSPVYDAFEVLMERFDDPEIWPQLYVKWEAGLLAAMGYGLDLSACAASGTTKNLTHISPRSGRAVSEAEALPYASKMLRLPQFMGGACEPEEGDVASGLKLTGYFLETRLSWGVNRTLPEARSRLVDLLNVKLAND